MLSLLLTNTTLNLIFEAHLAAVHLHGMLGLGYQLVTVELRRPRIILDLGVGAAAVVGPEELRCVCVAAQLHLAQLQPCPVGVQIGAPYKS